jgi:hypothetical protein
LDDAREQIRGQRDAQARPPPLPANPDEEQLRVHRLREEKFDRQVEHEARQAVIESYRNSEMAQFDMTQREVLKAKITKDMSTALKEVRVDDNQDTLQRRLSATRLQQQMQAIGYFKVFWQSEESLPDSLLAVRSYLQDFATESPTKNYSVPQPVRKKEKIFFTLLLLTEIVQQLNTIWSNDGIGSAWSRSSIQELLCSSSIYPASTCLQPCHAKEKYACEYHHCWRISDWQILSN